MCLRSPLLNSIDKIVLPEDISFREYPFAKKTLGAKAIDRDGVLKREQYFMSINSFFNTVSVSRYSRPITVTRDPD